MESGGFLSRSRLRSRAHTASQRPPSALPELETLSAYSALEARAVTLSEDEALVVARLAELLLADALRAYDDLEANGSRVDPRDWKLVRRRDQLAVFKQRKDAVVRPKWTTTATASSSGSSSGVGDVTGDMAATAARETVLPLLLVSGSLQSGTTLDDAMYGLASASTRDLKLASAYAEDGAVVDAAVLAALEQPSAADPFRFLGLKWVARRHAGSLKKRDLLFLEATGVTRRSNGDRVGYRVMHSVSVRALAQLGAVAVADSVVRAKSSVVQLFHEAAPASAVGSSAHGPLRYFSRGFYDPLGGMMQFVAISVAADLMLTLAYSAGDCAHHKKIARAAQVAQRDRQRRRRRATSTAFAAGRSPSAIRKSSTSRFPASNVNRYQQYGMHGIVEADEPGVVLYPPTHIGHDGDIDMSEAGDIDPADHFDEPTLELSPGKCHVCDCSLGGVFDRSASPCTICFHMICSRCSVTKKLRFAWSDESSRELHQHLVGSGIDTSGGGITASSTSQSASSDRSRTRSNSGGKALLTALGQTTHMPDVTDKALSFCLPCVVAANQQNAADIAIEEMTGISRVRAGSQMDGVTPKSLLTPMSRATAPSGPYGASRLSVSSTGSAATPRQRWTRGASIYGARPSYDLLDPHTADAISASNSSSSASRLPPRSTQYFARQQQPQQHQYRVYGGARQKAFSMAMAAPTPRDSAPKVVLFDSEEFARYSSRV